MISSQVVTLLLRLASAGSEGELQARSLPEPTFDLTTRRARCLPTLTSTPLQRVSVGGSHHKGLHLISRTKYLNIRKEIRTCSPPDRLSYETYLEDEYCSFCHTIARDIPKLCTAARSGRRALSRRNIIGILGPGCSHGRFRCFKLSNFTNAS